MSDERMRVLKMLEKGEISAEEATELLNALDEKPVIKKKEKKYIKILISENGEEKVNVKLPLTLAKIIARFIPQSAIKSMEEEDLDIKEIINAVESDLEEGPIVDIHDGGDSIVITVE